MFYHCVPRDVISSTSTHAGFSQGGLFGLWQKKKKRKKTCVVHFFYCTDFKKRKLSKTTIAKCINLMRQAPLNQKKIWIAFRIIGENNSFFWLHDWRKIKRILIDWQLFVHYSEFYFHFSVINNFFENEWLQRLVAFLARWPQCSLT